MNYLKAIDLLVEHEGFKKQPYKCSEDTWTIGYGSTTLYTRSIPAKKVTKNTFPITKAEARWNLVIYLDKSIDIAKTFVKNFDELSGVRQYCLAMMAYQLGFRLHKFKKTKTHIESGQWLNASIEMLDSEWAKQTPRRAEKTADIFYNNRW